MDVLSARERRPQSYRLTVWVVPTSTTMLPKAAELAPDWFRRSKGLRQSGSGLKMAMRSAVVGVHCKRPKQPRERSLGLAQSRNPAAISSRQQVDN